MNQASSRPVEVLKHEHKHCRAPASNSEKGPTNREDANPPGMKLSVYHTRAQNCKNTNNSVSSPDYKRSEQPAKASKMSHLQIDGGKESKAHQNKVGNGG